MSRFSNLEFQGAGAEDWESRSETVKDESFFLAEAQRAFERAEFEPGLRLFARALEENPKSTAAWTGQVRMLIELGEYREAKAWADKALEQHPHHAELLAAKAVALARVGDLDEAMAFSDASFEENGSTPYVWLARADVLLARKEQRADYCFDKALATAGRHWFVAWLAARIRLVYRQFAAALKHLQQASAWDAGQFVVWLQMGECEAALGYVGPARQSFGQCLVLNPQCQAAHTGLIQLRSGGVRRRFAGLWHRLVGR